MNVLHRDVNYLLHTTTNLFFPVLPVKLTTHCKPCYHFNLIDVDSFLCILSVIFLQCHHCKDKDGCFFIHV